LDHAQLREIITEVNYECARQVESRVDIAAKVTGELTSSLKVSIVEHVEEILNEVSKQRINQPMSNSWFQLMKEFIALNLIEIKVIGLFCI